MALCLAVLNKAFPSACVNLGYKLINSMKGIVNNHVLDEYDSTLAIPAAGSL